MDGVANQVKVPQHREPREMVHLCDLQGDDGDGRGGEEGEEGEKVAQATFQSFSTIGGIGVYYSNSSPLYVHCTLCIHVHFTCTCTCTWTYTCKYMYTAPLILGCKKRQCIEGRNIWPFLREGGREGGRTHIHTPVHVHVYTSTMYMYIHTCQGGQLVVGQAKFGDFTNSSVEVGYV